MTDEKKSAVTERPLDGLVICPSCNATMPFSFHCLTCNGAGAISKAAASALTRTKPFPKPKVVVAGNPTNGDRLHDMWTDNGAVEARR